MLVVETNHQIILLYFREGLSMRKIVKQFNICRASVKLQTYYPEHYNTLQSLLEKYLELKCFLIKKQRYKPQSLMTGAFAFYFEPFLIRGLSAIRHNVSGSLFSISAN